MRELTRKRADKPLPRLQRAADKRNAALTDDYAQLRQMGDLGGVEW